MDNQEEKTLNVLLQSAHKATMQCISRAHGMSVAAHLFKFDSADTPKLKPMFGMLENISKIKFTQAMDSLVANWARYKAIEKELHDKGLTIHAPQTESEAIG